MSAVTEIINELKRRNVIKMATTYAVASFIILQLCDIIFPAIGIPDATIGLVVIALGMGFPMLMIFVWMFELTPDGFRRTKEVEDIHSIRHFTGQRINHILTFLLSVALAFFSYQYYNPETELIIETAEPTEPAIEESLPVADSRPSICSPAIFQHE